MNAPTLELRVRVFRVWRLAVALLIVSGSRPWWRRASLYIVWVR